jgi:hypothetical protein
VSAGSSNARLAASSCDPSAHSPNWERGSTMHLKDETAEPGDTITPEEIRKDRFLLR